MTRSWARTVRRLSLAIALFAPFLAGTADAQQSYPTKPIQLISPYPPGGPNDAVARILGPKLTEILGQPIVVRNMVGANGAIAMSHLAKSAPDGYSVLLTTASPLVTNPHVFARLTYDPLKDFSYITTLVETEMLLFVHPSVPANTFEELIALAKTRDLRFGISGQGGQPQIILEKIKLSTGARIVTVPYTGSAVVTDVLAGHIDGTAFDMSSVVPLINEKRVKGISVMSHKAVSDFLPNVPSIGADKKYDPFVARSWIMLLTTANTPKPIVQKLYDAFTKAMNDPSVLPQLRAVSVTPLLSSSPEQASDFLRSEYEHFRQIVKETGIKVEN